MVLFLVSGVLGGFLLKEKHKFLLCADKIMTFSIYLFLFFLGMSVGTNRHIIDNIFIFGVKSLILCSGAIAGSVLASYFLYNALFKGIEQ